jgi:nicotinamidase-related amidase
MRVTFDPAHTAVLAMDCQTGIVSLYSKSQDEFIKRASGVLKAARALEMLVIQVQVGFRPGLPEMSSRNKILGGIKSSKPHQEFFQGSSGAIHPGLGPEPADIILTKHRVSAFVGTDLDMLLRANEIETIVLFGIATSGVVLSTLLQASDADYRLVVISDCCEDRDMDLQVALLDRFFPTRAEVITAEDFMAILPQR